MTARLWSVCANFCSSSVRYPPAWLTDYTARIRRMILAMIFSCGIAAERGGEINRATLTALLQFGFKQGVGLPHENHALL